jgi:transcriptional regulator with XRE-family HTH domain
MYPISTAADLGALVRRKRRSLDWTQEHLAAVVTTSRDWIVKLEKGKATVPLNMVLRVMAFLDLAMAVHDAAPVHLRSWPPAQGHFAPSYGDRASIVNARGQVPAADGRPRRARGRAEAKMEAPLEVGGRVQYHPADLSSFSPDSTRFHGEDYRPELQKMVAAVIEAEGPIFEDVLARQVAKAHGFARVSRKIEESVKNATQETLLRTDEEKRTILWPTGADPDRPIDFRWADPGTRQYSDVTLPELAGLARTYNAQNANNEEEVLLRMREAFGLSRTSEPMRQRFSKAVKLALSPHG